MSGRFWGRLLFSGAAAQRSSTLSVDVRVVWLVRDEHSPKRRNPPCLLTFFYHSLRISLPSANEKAPLCCASVFAPFMPSVHSSAQTTGPYFPSYFDESGFPRRQMLCRYSSCRGSPSGITRARSFWELYTIDHWFCCEQLLYSMAQIPSTWRSPSVRSKSVVSAIILLNRNYFLVPPHRNNGYERKTLKRDISTYLLAWG